MKILIISDSHTLRHIEDYKLFEHADILIHAGDSQLPANELENFNYKVRGNCDFWNDLEKYQIFTIGKNRFFLTHGDRYDDDSLLQAAKENDCNVVIHGHTHVVRCEMVEGVLFLNPGSLAKSRCKYSESYMVMDENKIYLKDAKTLKVIKEFNWISN